MPDYQFILGTLHNDFLEKETTDGVKLKDLLSKEVDASLIFYNDKETVLKQLLAYEFSEAESVNKKTKTKDSYDIIGELAQPNMRSVVDVDDFPTPIVRYGAGTDITMETFKQMNSAQFLAMHNAKLAADKQTIIRQLFRAQLLKTPSATVDALQKKSVTPLAFWNNDGSTPETNGQIEFASTHEHYIASNGTLGTGGSVLLNQSALVTEHKDSVGQMIHWAQPGATLNLIKALDDFRPVEGVAQILGAVNPDYNDSGLIQALVNTSKTLAPTIEIVGTWKDAIIISSPDMPANYILTTLYNNQNRTLLPLNWRNHPQFTGLQIVSPTYGNPIIGADAQYRRYLGVAVGNRSAGSALYVGGASWVEPTFI